MIDDLADRRLPCDVVLNSSPSADPGTYRELCGAGTLLLLGARFALVRDEFVRASDSVRRFDQVHEVLISLGGGSSRGAANIAVAAVREALPHVAITLAIGGDDSFDSNAAARHGVDVRRGLSAAEMAACLARADVAVGAGGTSAWERCLLGLPSVVLRLDTNQNHVVDMLVHERAALDGGRLDPGTARRLAMQVRELAADQGRRREVSTNAKKLIDGMGTRRATNVIDGVRVRPARQGDAELLWRWANDRVTRMNSFRQDEIPWSDHLAWLDRRLSDAGTLLLIGENTEGAVGQVRFELGTTIEVSISVAPEHRGAMVGPLMLAESLAHLEAIHGTNVVLARVRTANVSSRRMFEGAGFIPVTELAEQVVYERRVPR